MYKLARFERYLATVTLAAAAALPFITQGANATPGYARQTGLACEACHTVYPELTPFGRKFKLNAYVFSNVKQVQDINARNEHTLALAEFAPLSLQLQTSNTTLAMSLPDSGAPAVNDVARKNSTQFPQALSFFYTGKISDNLGAFLQVTWDPTADSIGMDNSDLRFADHASLGATDLIYGVSLNNNPTSQDVWNSTPAWGFPFIVSNVTIMPGTASLIDGGLAQQSVGVGPYVYLWDHLYIEVSAYQSAPTGSTNSFTGGPGPLDSTTPGSRVSGVAPYWRVAWEQDWDRYSLSAGTFGIRADTHPQGVGNHGPTDTFTDAAIDAQFQFIGDDHIASAYFTFIHEIRDFSATPAANRTNTLNTVRLTGNYFYERRYGGSLQLFSTTGSADSVLYAAAPVVGYAGSPDTRGLTAEADYLPWLNTKLGLAYTAYLKFNGASSNYDGSGRNASDNNTLYAFIWTGF